MTRTEALDFFTAVLCEDTRPPGTMYTGRLVPRGEGWSTRVYTMASWNDNHLTRAVFAAHDRGVRVQLRGSGDYMHLYVWPCNHPPAWGPSPTGPAHPSLEDAYASWREQHPLPTNPNTTSEVTNA